MVNYVIKRAEFRHTKSPGFLIGINEGKAVKLCKSKRIFEVCEMCDDVLRTTVKIGVSITPAQIISHMLLQFRFVTIFASV